MEYDEDLDIMFFNMACYEFHRVSAPGPWEWTTSLYWEFLSPVTQDMLKQFAPMVGMELHVFGPTLAIIYNPKRPSRWVILKRILHDTFASPTR